MITCSLKLPKSEGLHELFSVEEFKSARAECNVDVVKGELVFEIVAKDPVSAKAILNSILKIYETYEKTRAIK